WERCVLPSWRHLEWSEWGPYSKITRTLQWRTTTRSFGSTAGRRRATSPPAKRWSTFAAHWRRPPTSELFLGPRRNGWRNSVRAFSTGAGNIKELWTKGSGKD